jgi:hypothetical protein
MNSKTGESFMVSINWQFQATIPGGPAVTISQPAISVDAYDVVAVTIHASTSNIELPIQPTGTAGKVALLIVNSSLYDTGISFTVDSLTDTHVLDGPITLVGTGPVGLLYSGASPQKLIFSNTLANDINVQVVVGRKL